MKLLLDENLSRRILPRIEAHYPGSTQVALEALERAGDRAVWEFAKDRDFVIVSKDDDFVALQALLGFPPKLIRITLGNSSNDQVAKTLVEHAAEIIAGLSRPDVGLMELI